MATITVNVNDDTAAGFRAVAHQLYGQRKGALGKALDEAMSDWSKKQVYFDTCMRLLRSGVDMGRITYKKREELHERH